MGLPAIISLDKYAFLAQLNELQLANSTLVLALISLLIITALIYLLDRNRKRYKKELDQKTTQIRQLRDQMVLKNARNNVLQTEVSRTSEQITSLDEFKAALAHLVGHDLKNTLNGILGLSRNTDDKIMKAIQECGQMALAMVTNMLDVQRFEEEQVTLRLRHHCIRETLAQAQAQVQFLFVIKRLNLKIDIPEGILVLIDKEMMSRALVNLLVNAVKYSKVGTTVHVGVRNVVDQSGQALTQIYLRDEGNGIAPEKIPYIFDRYWQRDTKDIGKVASAGLGLVFSKYVLEAHGGTIEVESEQGRGTTFLMHIPFVEAMAEGCDTTHTSLSILRDELSITNEQLELIREHGKRLYELKVYEITKIREVINELSELNVKTTWTGELQMAVYQGNQQKYDELVGMIQ